jgi:hypothetical protein
MTDETGLSRRRLLALVGGTGTASAFAGATTGALLSGANVLPDNLLRGGAVDLAVDWEGAGSSGSSERQVAVPIEVSPERMSGSVEFTVSIPDDGPNNPVHAWLRSTCPEIPTALANQLYVTLSSMPCPGERPTRNAEIHSGTLREVLDKLRDGVALDPDGTTTEPGGQSCLSPGEDVCLVLAWQLDPYYQGSESTTFELTFLGQQCRNDEGTTSPFPAAPEGCAGPTCDCCVQVGKLEFEDIDVAAGGSYDFDEGREDLALQVTDTETKADDDGTETVGIGFRVVDDDGAVPPNLCGVAVKGGTDTVEYDSPSSYAPHTGTLSDDGLLYAPARAADVDGPEGYHAISHLTVSVCRQADDGVCPDDEYAPGGPDTDDVGRPAGGDADGGATNQTGDLT